MRSFERFLINKVAGISIMPKKVRRMFLRISGIKIESSSRIMSDVFFDTNNVSIGKNSFVNRFCQFHDGGYNAQIVIGNEVMIAMNVNLCAISHDIGNANRRAGKSYIKKIEIEDGCWVGANVVILPGVTIAKGCVIAAGSVVNKNTEQNGLYVGVPARRIKTLD